jgi:hypothetical protein
VGGEERRSGLGSVVVRRCRRCEVVVL